jgi:hypothetical protein
MRFPEIVGVTFEENSERLKIMWPLRRNWFLYILFSASLLVWVGMLIAILNFVIGDVIIPRERYAFVLTVMMLVWLVIYYYLGRMLWQRWQYVAATREIVFIYKDDQVVVRRPLSLWGITTAYDYEHVSPFSYDPQRQSMAFKYGVRFAHFGHSLSQDEAAQLIEYVNFRFFPEEEEED